MKYLTEPIYVKNYRFSSFAKTWTNAGAVSMDKSFLTPQISQELMFLRQPQRERHKSQQMQQVIWLETRLQSK